jgi:dTDP-4-amino-4,6-dideoxygalactose transaminase
MLNTNLAPWPCFSEEEAQAVSRVLKSNRVNYWTGNEGRNFEKEFAEWCCADYAIALANGTAALELALRALNIGVGDDVIVTPRSFIASVSCAVAVGANPVFADVDRNSGNITAETISEVLTPNTKAVICVHLAGWPCDMDPIMDLAKQHNLKVIEDCAQAHGARYKGRSVGTLGHIGAWSFCQDKIITTGGEGGMVTTNDCFLWKKMWSYKDHGKDWDAVNNKENDKGFRWLHHTFGTNWRMTEMQAAIGRIQLRRMAEWTSLRNRNARRIWNTCSRYSSVRVPEFKCNDLSCPAHCDMTRGCVHALYKCYVYIKSENLADGWNRDRILLEINEQGVPCYQGSCSEIYRERCFKDLANLPEKEFPVAKELGETSLMFLVHPTLKESEISKTCEVLDKVFSRATR